MDARNLRQALPEVRALYLSDAEFFLDQLRPAGYLQAPMNTGEGVGLVLLLERGLLARSPP